MSGSSVPPAGTAPAITCTGDPAVAGGPLASPGRYVLIGSRTAHSPSPALWNRVFRAAHVDTELEARDTAPAQLGQVFADVRAGALRGAFFTMPFKEDAARAADAADDCVRRSGVANLLLARDGQLTSHNTDVLAVSRLTQGRRFARVLLLGSGGAARAAAAGLAGRVGELVIAGPDPRQVGRLVDATRDAHPAVSGETWSERARLAAESDLIVNATPLGMSGDELHAPLPAAVFGPGTSLYDFVYRPDGSPTPLQDVALACGADVSDGLAHLEAQAICALPFVGLASELETALVQALADTVGSDPRRWSRR
ncbi:MAG TPA: hypothetical protein VFN55_07845 [Solirubrobacteraceae bacterium]|nr:hypothetical protein [Solirubrobacteraceae bacterium]